MTTESPLAVAPKRPLWLVVCFWICTVIAVAVVVRRVVALLHPGPAPTQQMAALDSVFASHAALTLAHILPALAFVLATPFFIFRGAARSHWAANLLFPLGAVVGLTAYAMSTHAVGGWLERSAVLFFNTLFLWSLFRAFRYRQSGRAELECRWLTRAVFVLLGIATTRPVMGIFFATSRLTHLEPQQFFGMAFWIGFSINTLVGEWWLRSPLRARLRLSIP